ncbi:MAG: hypothetical protein J6W09_11255 [Bacteroidales bacterium]|nr:hypothetical protein [Bacteroidales bacterium]
MDNYISKLDEIDKWLFDSFGILPGACSSTENLRHTTARMVAEVLWPKKDFALTWEDIRSIIIINEKYTTMLLNSTPWDGIYTKTEYEEVLRRFNEQRKK